MKLQYIQHYLQYIYLLYLDYSVHSLRACSSCRFCTNQASTVPEPVLQHRNIRPEDSNCARQLRSSWKPSRTKVSKQNRNTRQYAAVSSQRKDGNTMHLQGFAPFMFFHYGPPHLVQVRLVSIKLEGFLNYYHVQHGKVRPQVFFVVRFIWHNHDKNVRPLANCLVILFHSYHTHTLLVEIYSSTALGMNVRRFGFT